MKKKHVYLLLCIVWMGVIFYFSAQVADDSQEMSNIFVYLLDAIFSLDVMRNAFLQDVVSFLVRKAAHMSEYAVLAILIELYFREYKGKSCFVLSLLCTMLYASSDEIHQLFVPGRSGQVMDVMIDALGGAIGLGLLYVVGNVRRKKRDR